LKGSFNYAIAATPVMPGCFSCRLLTLTVHVTDRLPGLQQELDVSPSITLFLPWWLALPFSRAITPCQLS